MFVFGYCCVCCMCMCEFVVEYVVVDLYVGLEIVDVVWICDVYLWMLDEWDVVD